MAYTLTVSNAQMKKAYSDFCNAWIGSLTGEDGPLEERHGDLLRESLTTRLGEVGKKSPKKAKKSPEKDMTPKGPSKRELKAQELRDELKTTYGIESSTATISDLRKEIAAAKKAQKPKMSPKKATPKGPSKREVQAQELRDELKSTYGIESSTSSISALRKEIAAAKKAQNPKKSPKKATPKGASKREVQAQELRDELKTTYGIESSTTSISDLRKEIAAAKKAQKPKKSPKKATPKGPSKREVQAQELRDELKTTYGIESSTTSISALRKEIATAKKAHTTKVKQEQKKQEKKEQKVSVSTTDLIAELVGAPVTNASKDKDELEEEVIDDTDDLDELDELGELDDDSSDDEADVEFPGMERVEEFEHDSRPNEKMYIDQESYVWNDEQELVGVYDDTEDVIVEE